MNAVLIPIILSAAAVPAPLTIGSPSPKLAELTFVVGAVVFFGD